MSKSEGWMRGETKLEPVFNLCRGADITWGGAMGVVWEMSRTFADEDGEDLRGTCSQWYSV